MPVLMATDPQFGHLARQMGKFLDQMQRGYSNFARDEAWSPNVNLYETQGSYVVCVDLAGVDKDKIEITVDRHVLKLRGHRQVPAGLPGTASEGQGARVRVHLMEIDHGAFCREVELPEDVMHAEINARHDNGLLWIELPRMK